MVGSEEELLGRLKDQLLGRVPKGPEGNQVGCFVCRLVLEDLVKHGKLTDKHPEKSFDGSTAFPALSKKIHLGLEGFWLKELMFLLPEVEVKK